MPRCMTAHQFDTTSRAIESFGKQSQQRLVGRRVHWRRGDFDPQLISERLPDFVRRRARLELDGQRHAIRLNGQEFRQILIGRYGTRR